MDIPDKDVPAAVTVPHIKAGSSNDPSVTVGFSAAGGLDDRVRQIMEILGFLELNGSFVHNVGGRAIWVDLKSMDELPGVIRQVAEQGEAIGRRTKINEIRKAIDLPFGEIGTVS